MPHSNSLFTKSINPSEKTVAERFYATDYDQIRVFEWNADNTLPNLIVKDQIIWKSGNKTPKDEDGHYSRFIDK